MKDKPLISCIIPTFNRSQKLENAVRSILNQTYRNIEILVIDDQSVDNTKQVVSNLSGKDKRIKYLYNPEKGSNQARNWGIKNAQGQFIALLDDDDIWIETKLEEQYGKFVSNPDAGLVFCTFARSKNNGKTQKKHPSFFFSNNPEKIRNKLLKHNFITTSAILVKKEVFDNIGDFDTNFSSFQDWELLTRIALKYPLVYLKELLVLQYESPDSITRNKKGRLLSNIKHLKKFYKEYQAKPKILSTRCYHIGISCIKQKRRLFANLFFAKSIKQNPLNINALIWYLCTKPKK